MKKHIVISALLVSLFNIGLEASYRYMEQMNTSSDASRRQGVSAAQARQAAPVRQVPPSTATGQAGTEAPPSTTARESVTRPSTTAQQQVKSGRFGFF